MNYTGTLQLLLMLFSIAKHPLCGQSHTIPVTVANDSTTLHRAQSSNQENVHIYLFIMKSYMSTQ